MVNKKMTTLNRDICKVTRRDRETIRIGMRVREIKKIMRTGTIRTTRSGIRIIPTIM